MSISGEKDALRAQLRARLSQSDPAENAACDVRITLQVLSLPAFQAAERIFAYCSVVPEVDTHAILAQARRCGKTVALPVTQPDGQMRFARYDGALVPGRFGIPEPPRSARTLLPQPGDLMLVPALAYDRAGRRLGRGGGYYDRFLARVDCCTVGLIRAAFLLDALPAEWNDVPVSAVLIIMLPLFIIKLTAPGGAPIGVRPLAAAAAAVVIVVVAAAVAPAAAAEEQDQNEDDPETAIIISAAHNQNPFSAQLIFAWPDPARCMDLAQCFPA